MRPYIWGWVEFELGRIVRLDPALGFTLDQLWTIAQEKEFLKESTLYMSNWLKGAVLLNDLSSRDTTDVIRFPMKNDFIIYTLFSWSEYVCRRNVAGYNNKRVLYKFL